jgi:hypothetical protein
MKLTYTKEQLKDNLGRPLTQGLFLEIGYKTEFSVFTLNDEDKTYNGKIYPSLKKLFLTVADPTEYEFARTCLLGWNHWKRLNANKQLEPYFQDWREELEVLLRSEGVRNLMDLTSSEGGNFQAAKWMAEKGWDKKTVGRPSKYQKEREDRISDRIADELNDTVVRMENFKHG